MKTFSLIVTPALILLIGVSADVVFTVGSEARNFLRTSEATLAHVNDALAEAQLSTRLGREHLDRDLTEIGLASASVRKTALEFEKASAAQESYWKSYGKQVATTIDSVNALVQHTDESLNQKLLPATIATLDETKATITETNRSIRETNEELKPVFAGLAETTAKAAALLSDPAITESLRHVDATSQNVEAITGHINESTALLEAKVRQLTKPASLAARVGGYLLSLLASAGNVMRMVVR